MGLNHRPFGYQPNTLTTELRTHFVLGSPHYVVGLTVLELTHPERTNRHGHISNGHKVTSVIVEAIDTKEFHILFVVATLTTELCAQ